MTDTAALFTSRQDRATVLDMGDVLPFRLRRARKPSGRGLHCEAASAAECDVYGASEGICDLRQGREGAGVISIAWAHEEPHVVVLSPEGARRYAAKLVVAAEQAERAAKAGGGS